MTAYIVLTRTRMHDTAEFKIYGELAKAAQGDHPLTPLAFCGEIDMLEGDPIEGAVILSFPSMAAAQAWYHSPAYQEAMQHRLKAADYTIFITEGVDATE
jgi:uncharacterized protein (DUF1330 family)